MPWKVLTVSDARLALCHSVRSASMPVAAAATRFGVSRKTAHKWLKVFDADSNAHASAMADRSRRPHTSPARTSLSIQNRALALRDQYNWGARKIHFRLKSQGHAVPSIRTICSILSRNGRIHPPSPTAPLQRFERAEPNELWQIDFKGPLEVDRKKVTPLTVLDDHSRYLLAFQSCTDHTMATVWKILWEVFGQVGLPMQILCDNAFGSRGERPAGLSWFDSRLVRLGITPSHGRPYHPQTQGKVEALHRSVNRELLNFNARRDNQLHFQQDCDAYRHLYNTVRPHQALGDQPPVLLWMPSPRKRPDRLPEVHYPTGSVLRRVNDRGRVSFKNYRILCGLGIEGDHVRIEERDHELAVFYCNKQIRCLFNEQLRTDIIL